MAQRTYGFLAEIIITQYGKKVRSDNFIYTLRHVAEMIAQEVAWFAKADALEQDRLGESVFANDQFITTYFGLSLLTDDAGTKYVEMPNTPTGLPMGREIDYVGFTGNKSTQVIPMRNKDMFMQQMTKTPKWMILYYVENGRINFYNLSGLVTASTVDLKMVGSVADGELIDQVLNIPKNYESSILDKVLARMNTERNVLPDQINDNISR